MENDRTFYLNPYAAILESDSQYIIHGVEENRIVLLKGKKAVVDYLLTAPEIKLAELSALAGDAVTAKLVKTKAIVSTHPPVKGRFSRQEGFFSLLAEDYTTHSAAIASAHILLLGAGAIGTHVLWNLAAMGIKNITLVDYDLIEDSNLNRQLLYDPEDIGRPKVDVLREKMERFAPHLNLVCLNRKIESPADIEQLIGGKTMVIKAIDTPQEATYWVNEVCVARQIPYITGGFLDYEGIIGPIYIPGKSVCAECGGRVVTKRLAGKSPTFAPLTAMVASRMSMLIYKIIVGESIQEMTNKIYAFNTKREAWRVIPTEPVAKCRVCGCEPSAEKQAKQRLRVTAVYGVSLLAFLAMTLLGRLVSIDHFLIYNLLTFFAAALFMTEMVRTVSDQGKKELFSLTGFYVTLNLIVSQWAEARKLASLHRFDVDVIINGIFFVSETILGICIGITVLYFVAYGVSVILDVAASFLRRLPVLQRRPSSFKA